MASLGLNELNDIVHHNKSWEYIYHCALISACTHSITASMLSSQGRYGGIIVSSWEKMETVIMETHYFNTSSSAIQTYSCPYLNHHLCCIQPEQWNNELLSPDLGQQTAGRSKSINSTHISMARCKTAVSPVQALWKLLDLYRSRGPVFLQDIFLFQHWIPYRGASYKNYFNRQSDRHNKGFQQSSAVFIGLGPRTSGFFNVCSALSLEILQSCSVPWLWFSYPLSHMDLSDSTSATWFLSRWPASPEADLPLPGEWCCIVWCRLQMAIP